MEPLTGEARDRVRTMSLWLVAGLVLLGVALGLYATLVGFTRTTVAPSDIVSVSEDGRQVTVDLAHGGCQRPAGVTVDEGEDVVLLTAYVSERRPLLGQNCLAILNYSRETVVLESALGGRELRTARP